METPAPLLSDLLDGGIGPSLDGLVARCLAKQRALRPANAQEFREALATAMEGALDLSGDATMTSPGDAAARPHATVSAPVAEKPDAPVEPAPLPATPRSHPGSQPTASRWLLVALASALVVALAALAWPAATGGQPAHDLRLRDADTHRNTAVRSELETPVRGTDDALASEIGQPDAVQSPLAAHTETGPQTHAGGGPNEGDAAADGRDERAVSVVDGVGSGPDEHAPEAHGGDGPPADAKRPSTATLQKPRRSKPRSGDRVKEPKGPAKAVGGKDVSKTKSRQGAADAKGGGDNQGAEEVRTGPAKVPDRPVEDWLSK